MVTKLPWLFWEKVNKDARNGCWEWTACLNNYGYGHSTVYLNTDKAHRIAYQDRYGILDKGVELHHLCENKKCVNPDHLIPLTKYDHSVLGIPERKIAFQKYVSSITHCIRGHNLDVANTLITRAGKRSCRECNRIRRITNSSKKAKAGEMKVLWIA